MRNVVLYEFSYTESSNVVRNANTVLKFHNKLCFHVTFGYVWTRLQLWSSRKFKVYLILNKIVSQWQSCIFEFWWRYRLRNISHTSISALSQAQRRRSRMNNVWRFGSSGLLKLCLRKIIFEWFRFKQLSKHIYYYLVQRNIVWFEYQLWLTGWINMYIHTNPFMIHFKIYGMRNKHSNYVYQLAGGKI